MRCGPCQFENREGVRFCEQCGATLEQTCPVCGAVLPPDRKFCGACGQPLTAPSPAPSKFASPQAYTPKHLAEKILTSRSALEGERKQVTVLFCDLANSTALAERLGPEAMHTLLDRFFELALAEVHRYEGTINQFLGDGFMALFGAPLAHEDHARRAVLAGLGIHRGLKERRGDLGLPPGETLAVRMGLNTGLVVVGKIGDSLRMDYTAVGDTTNLAARLQQLAEPGWVYLSETTQRGVRDYFECEPLGTRTVKGKGEPVAVYKVLGGRAYAETLRERAARGISSPLIGRGVEIAALMGCIEWLLAGHGGLAAVVSEAGLGKSRLIAEARRQVADRELRWLEGRAVSFGQTISYWPFLEIIKSAVGIAEEDGASENWAKLERCVTALFPGQVADVLPYLATLLGLEVRGELEKRVKYLDGQAMGRQILLSSRRFFERLAREHPLLLVFEDAHWMDQSSAELLEHLLPLVEIVPLLICSVGRPDPETAVARFRDIGTRKYAGRYTEITLSPLSPTDSRRLMQSLLQIDDLSPRVRELILGRAEGNPFFMEEVIRALIDMGLVARDEATGGWRATPQVDEITIPDTIQGVIMARIDRLDDDVKQVLKGASVIGRSFFYRVLRAISEAERELDQHLAELQHLELIREKKQIPELEYIFKHALVQEATYESILSDRRRQLHRRVGECLQALFADRLEEFYGLLAYHYARAEEWEKAQAYLFKAGDQAGKIAADAEALAHYRRAVETYARAFGDRWDPLQRAVLERKMGEALFRRGDHEHAIEYLQRALTYLGHPHPTSRWGIRLGIIRQLIRQVGHRVLPSLFLRQTAARAGPVAEERARIYEMIGWIDYFMNHERLVLDALTHLNSAERNGLPLAVVHGSTGVGIICDTFRLSWLAGHYHRRAVALAEQMGQPVAVGSAYLGLGFHEHLCLGKWESALQRYRRAAAAFREAGETWRWGGATALAAALAINRGDFVQSLEHSQALLRVGRDSGDRHVGGLGSWVRGWTLTFAGELDEAVAALRETIEAIPDYGSVAEASGFLGLCYLRQGKLGQALAVLEESSRLIAQRGLRGHQVASTRWGMAEACLATAEQAAGPERAKALRKARRACRALAKQSRTLRPAVAGSCRLRGTYEWLRGRPATAQKWWQRSLVVAEELGARYDVGLAYLEMGKRLGQRAHLERAEAIFADIGAKLDLALARDLLHRGRT